MKDIGSVMDKDSEPPDVKHRERRRRRAENTTSRSLDRELLDDEQHEEGDDGLLAPAPPMPLMSDINPSEITRTSIQSAVSDRPYSASEELANSARELVQGQALTASGISTPTRAHSPINHERHAFAMHQANVSHGDLTALPRGTREFGDEYDTDEYGRKIPMDSYSYDYNGRHEEPESVDYASEHDYEERYYITQDVPSPLRYVPYQAGTRGLSPIPSVSGYTEAGSEAHLPQNYVETASPTKSLERARKPLSSHSDDSIPRNLRSREFDSPSAADGDRTDEMRDGHAVRGIGLSPKLVHQAMGVESAVASLVESSVLEPSVVTDNPAYYGPDVPDKRDSITSYEEQSKAQLSRGLSCADGMDIDDLRALEEERLATPGSKSAAQSHEYSEYEVDEYGRKVPRTKYRHSPTASEAAITAGAVGAAAAALKAAKQKKQEAAEGQFVEDFQPAGVARNRSFKERTMHQGWEPQTTPTHSVDRLDLHQDAKLSASDARHTDENETMPETSYFDTRLQASSPFAEGRLNGESAHHEGSGKQTPTQRQVSGQDRDGLGLAEAAGAAALGAAAGMAATRSREVSQEPDDWQRTSDERKRDTLVTNPYEDASPIVNPELNDNLLAARGLDTPFSAGSPGFANENDEGYLPNGLDRIPDAQQQVKEGHRVTDDDPFYAPNSHSQSRHLSGMSQGMASPFYDAAMGTGIERIENKDIVALMQHVSRLETGTLCATGC